MLRNWVIFNKVPTEQLIRVKHIHVFEGGRSALYITSGDIVYGVGANGNYNLLGLSGRHRQFSLVLDPVSVERLSLKSINTIAVGDYFGVANNTNGELYHWGRRMDKRRGILLPHQVKCPYFVISIACGSEFFVILTKEQKVFFRGTFQQNDHPISEFTEVSIELSVSSISCGIFHAAMLTTDGKVYNCGYDHHATYRSWKAEEGLIPKKLELREQCTQVVCGRRSTVCLLSSGTVWACGENDNLGVESENSVMKHPAKVKILEPIRELAATWFSNIFAASSWSGRIYWWGYKTRWPTVISGACVLLDAFRNKETPSSLGLVPVAPQLSPCSSFNTKTTYWRSVVNLANPEVAARLERSLSAEDLSTSHYPLDKEVADRNNNGRNGQTESSGAKTQLPNTSKSNKNLPPGFGMFRTAGKFLAARPSDRQVNTGGKARRRAVSPEAHPAKNPKAQFSIASETPTDLSQDIARSQSMENLDSQPSPPNKRKPRVLSMFFGRNLNDPGRKTPLASPETETGPSFYVPKTPEQEKLPVPDYLPSSQNPFFECNDDVSIYPKIPLPTEECPPEFNMSIATNKDGISKNRFSSSNPFLYDPMDTIEFKFKREAAECYAEKKSSTESIAKEPNSSSNPTNYNPGTKATLKYYCALADIKSDVVELQTIVNELVHVIQNL